MRLRLSSAFTLLSFVRTWSCGISHGIYGGAVGACGIGYICIFCMRCLLVLKHLQLLLLLHDDDDDDGEVFVSMIIMRMLRTRLGLPLLLLSSIASLFTNLTPS